MTIRQLETSPKVQIDNGNWQAIIFETLVWRNADQNIRKSTKFVAAVLRFSLYMVKNGLGVGQLKS